VNNTDRSIISDLFVVLFALLASLALVPDLVAGQSKLTSTTEASDKFGKGGKLETTSDEQFRVVKEVWKDATGKNRETHLISYDAKGIVTERWYLKDETFTAERHIEDGKWNGEWDVSSNTGYRASKVTSKIIADKIKSLEAKAGAVPDRPNKTAESDKKIPAAEAAKRIKAHLAYIEKRTAEMKAAFYYEGAKKTLEASFKKSGVGKAMRYATDWGEMGIGLFWSERLKEFYSYAYGHFENYLTVIEKDGFATESFMSSVDSLMELWKQKDQNILKQMQSLVESYTKQALLEDDIGKSDDNYYAQLDELQKKKPLPTKEIDELNRKRKDDDKAYLPRLKKIDKEIADAKQTADDLAHPFRKPAKKDDAGADQFKPD